LRTSRADPHLGSTMSETINGSYCWKRLREAAAYIT